MAMMEISTSFPTGWTPLRIRQQCKECKRMQVPIRIDIGKRVIGQPPVTAFINPWEHS